MTNRRSRPRIIRAANGFASTIQGRLEKEMKPDRTGAEHEVITWSAATEIEEADQIAREIQVLRNRGYRYRDIAVLVRSSTSYPRLLEAFARRSIPVTPGGRTGLFKEPDAQRFGQTFAFLAGHEWRAEAFGRGAPVDLVGLVDSYAVGFSLDARARRKVAARLAAWAQEACTPTGPANLVGDWYGLVGDCGVAEWDLRDPAVVSRLGSLARCSAVLADFESVRRRARPDVDAPGEVVGGQDRGEWYYRWLAIHIQNWALGAFEGFEGEDDLTIDAVDLTTIHKAKGLEWPVVFVPCVSAKRFPSSMTGRAGTWLVPTECFDRRRYEGSVNDERRLFYVALTGARDWVSVSTHDTPGKQTVPPSPFLVQLAGGKPAHKARLPLPPPPQAAPASDEELLSITFSDLATFAECGAAYRLRHLIGFQPRLVPELGYGRAVHHVLRQVAEHTRRRGRPPSAKQLDRLFDDTFFLPATTKPAHRQLKAAARRLVDRYVMEYGDDLRRVWAVERPFELHLPSAVVSGRADVILDEENGVPTALAIVDYKTATDPTQKYDLQLQVYTDAGRREGLDVRAAYVHDLRAADRSSVDVSQGAVAETEAEVTALLGLLRKRVFLPVPEHDRCAACDVRPMCRDAAS